MILYNYYIKKAQNTNIELNISGVGTGASDSSGKGIFTGNIEDNYDKTEIYKKFSKKHSEEHADLRKKRKKKDGNDGGGDSGGTSQLAKLKRKLENQRYQIAALHSKAKGGRDKLVDSDSDGE